MSTDLPAGMRSALRYYERRGLLAELDRSPGGHRLSLPFTGLARP